MKNLSLENLMKSSAQSTVKTLLNLSGSIDDFPELRIQYLEELALIWDQHPYDAGISNKLRHLKNYAKYKYLFNVKKMMLVEFLNEIMNIKQKTIVWN
jgi:hypothetical protein